MNKRKNNKISKVLILKLSHLLKGKKIDLKCCKVVNNVN
jgi:hypothetical protein